MSSLRKFANRWQTLVFLISFASFCLPLYALTQPSKATNVLVLYSLEREAPIYSSFDKALRSQLESPESYPLTYYTEYLDLMRFPEESQQAENRLGCCREPPRAEVRNQKWGCALSRNADRICIGEYSDPR